jgi:hypothetical protein
LLTSRELNLKIVSDPGLLKWRFLPPLTIPLLVGFDWFSLFRSFLHFELKALGPFYQLIAKLSHAFDHFSNAPLCAGVRAPKMWSNGQPS